MPGRILIVDPIVTNRVVLKAQLTADYYTVDLASDITSIHGYLAKSPPDAIVLRYEVEENIGFSTCKELKCDPRFSHIPVILICRNMEDTLWNTAYQLGIEEVLPNLADGALLRCRLAQLIRKKEVVEEYRVRQRTYADMGFAEESLVFPPQFPGALNICFADAVRFMPSFQDSAVGALLKTSFPVLETNDCSENVGSIALIDEAQLGREEALRRLCALHDAQTLNAPKLLYLANQNDTSANCKALELGADDFIVRPFSAAELAVRLRRLGWQRHLALQAERQVSNRLKEALRDPMTGLYNRRYALQYLDRLLRNGGPADRTVAVMMLDLDNFKAINDTYGHQTGDAVICETAQRLNRKLRSADLISRVGGEEFLVVLTDTPVHQACSIAERMRLEINEQPFLNCGIKRQINISISIGVAFATAGQFKPCELIHHADRALYQSKGRGRNQVTFLPQAA